MTCQVCNTMCWQLRSGGAACTCAPSAAQDLENTVGSWEMYGVEDSKRYPQIQAEFFERSAGPLTRREAMYSFLAACEPLSFHILSRLPPRSCRGNQNSGC